jgi:hypothetical protein
LLDRSQIVANGMRILAIEFEFGHVGVAGRNAAFEQPRKLVEIEALPERAERWRAPVRAVSRFPDCMAGGAKFPNKGTSATRRILRVSRADAYCKYSEKPEELHGIIFCKSGAPVRTKLRTRTSLKYRSNSTGAERSAGQIHGSPSYFGPQAAVCGGLALNDYFHLLTAFLTLESAHLAL